MLIRRFKFRLDIDACLLSHFSTTSRPHAMGLWTRPVPLIFRFFFFSPRVAFDTNKRFLQRDSSCIIFYSR